MHAQNIPLCWFVCHQHRLYYPPAGPPDWFDRLESASRTIFYKNESCLERIVLKRSGENISLENDSFILGQGFKHTHPLGQCVVLCAPCCCARLSFNARVVCMRGHSNQRVCVCFQKRSDSRLTADEDGSAAETGQWGIWKVLLIVCICVFACARACINVCVCVCVVGGCSMPRGNGIIGTNPPQGSNPSSPPTEGPASVIFDFKGQTLKLMCSGQVRKRPRERILLFWFSSPPILLSS